MEANWGRSKPFISLTEEQVREYLLPLGRAVSASEALSSGHVNTNYRVSIVGESTPLALRIYTREPFAQATEVALLDLVAEAVPVPRVLYVGTSPPQGGKPYIVTSWLEGRLLDELLSETTTLQRSPGSAAGAELRQRSMGRAAGATLARIHRIRFDRPGFFAADGTLGPSGTLPPYREYIEGCLFREGGALLLGEQLAGDVLRFIDEHEALLPGPDTEPVLVHGDYKGSNLLLQPAGRSYVVSGVLDWEFAHAGPALFDLAILLRHSDTMPAFEAGVIQGYRISGGKLPDGWKQTIRLLDFANLAGFLTGEAAAQRAADVAMLFETTMNRWESYATA